MPEQVISSYILQVVQNKHGQKICLQHIRSGERFHCDTLDELKQYLYKQLKQSALDTPDSLS